MVSCKMKNKVPKYQFPKQINPKSQNSDSKIRACNIYLEFVFCDLDFFKKSAKASK